MLPWQLIDFFFIWSNEYINASATDLKLLHRELWVWTQVYLNERPDNKWSRPLYSPATYSTNYSHHRSEFRVNPPKSRPLTRKWHGEKWSQTTRSTCPLKRQIRWAVVWTWRQSYRIADLRHTQCSDWSGSVSCALIGQASVVLCSDWSGSSPCLRLWLVKSFS